MGRLVFLYIILTIQLGFPKMLSPQQVGEETIEKKEEMKFFEFLVTIENNQVHNNPTNEAELETTM